jgi:hypothetical protein
MVVPLTCGVHGQPAIVAGRPLYPQSAQVWAPQSWGISCAQTAIIPTNSEIDVSAAASSTNIFNMPSLQRMLEHKKNIVPLLFQKSRVDRPPGNEKDLDINQVVNGVEPGTLLPVLVE